MPCTLMATPFSTVVISAQVSGQSCGQAPRNLTVSFTGLTLAEMLIEADINKPEISYKEPSPVANQAWQVS